MIPFYFFLIFYFYFLKPPMGTTLYGLDAFRTLRFLFSSPDNIYLENFNLAELYNNFT